LTAADFVRQLLQEGDNEAALATVQNARRAARTDMSLGLIEGIALIRLQRYAEAAALLIDIAKQNPRNAEVHAPLGAAMMGAGFYDEARETLQMAIRLDKNLPECHYNLAQLYAFIEPVTPAPRARHYRNARDLGVAADPQIEAALK
jgi:Flp pilus assembly protein TadD